MGNEEIRKIQENYTKNDMMTLWDSMKKLVFVIAKRYTYYEDMEDLMQEGYIAVHEAMQHYDETMCVPFGSYAAYWVRKRIQKYIAQCGKVIRIPEKLKWDTWKLKKFIDDYTKEHGRKPNIDEMRAFMDCGDKYIGKVLCMAEIEQIGSLNKEMEDGYTLSDTIQGKDNEESIINSIYNQWLSDILWGEVAKLQDVKRELLIMQYKKEYEKKEIADKLNIKESDIAPIRRQAMKSLRKSKRIRSVYMDIVEAASYRHVGVDYFNTTWNSSTEIAALKI